MKALGLIFILCGSTLKADGFRFIPAEKFGLEKSGAYDSNGSSKATPGRKLQSYSSDLSEMLNADDTYLVVVQDTDQTQQKVTIRQSQKISHLSESDPHVAQTELLVGYIVLDSKLKKSKQFEVSLPQEYTYEKYQESVFICALRPELIQKKKKLRITPSYK